MFQQIHLCFPLNTAALMRAANGPAAAGRGMAA